MYTSGIYRYTNLINNKSYIGQAFDLLKRKKRHEKDYLNEELSCYNYPLYKAFRKYKYENFKYEILEFCPINELDEKEKYYIQIHDSYFIGYNQTLGGNGGSRSISIDKIKLKNITKRLQTTNDLHSKIALDFEVSVEMIQGINTGRYWKRDIKYPLQNTKNKRSYKTKLPNKYCLDCGKEITKVSHRCTMCNQQLRRTRERPEPIHLVDQILKYGFKEVGRIYGVSDNAIRKWCKAFKIPCSKYEMSIWMYQNQ